MIQNQVDKKILMEIKMDSVLQFASTADTSVDTKARTMVATITTSALSHNGHVILPQGIDMVHYRKNPVVAWGHMYFLPPIGTNVWIKRVGESLVAKTRFATRPENHEGEWLPDTVLSLYAQDVLKGVSIGAKPTKQKYSRDFTKEDLKEFPQLKDADSLISEAELLEYSCCTLPANPEALKQALTSMDISPSLSNVITNSTTQFVELDKHTDIEQLPTKEKLTDEQLACMLGLKESTPENVDGSIHQAYPDEHCSKVRDRNKFNSVSLLTHSFDEKQYRVLWGVLKENGKKSVCEFRYPNSTWSTKEANDHCKAHGGNTFTPAKEQVVHGYLGPVLMAEDVLTGFKAMGTPKSIAEKMIKRIGIEQAVHSAINKVRGKV